MQLKRTLRIPALLALVLVACLAVFTQAQADVTPATFTATLEPGESASVTKKVDVPAVPPKLDMMLMVDNSGSYGGDLPVITGLAPGIAASITGSGADAQFALGTFVDFPFSPWGNAGAPCDDYAYNLNQPLTPSVPAWTGAVGAMTIRCGGDTPESQYESLFQAATGVGRELPGSVDGDFTDLGEIAPTSAGWRADATKVIALTTDAPFHEAGEAGGPFPYPGASSAATTAALTAAGIKVVAIKAPGSGGEMDALAAATGGSVVTTGSSSDEIGTAILSGLAALTFNVTATPVGCDPLDISYTPSSHTGVSGGSTVMFDETITVPAGTTAADLPPSGTVTCTVEFKADDTVIGVQTITIHVDLNEVPDCSTLTASPNVLWPPNHKLTPVGVSGATDADGDPLTYAITGVTQDEPVDGLGDGDTAPDAMLGPAGDEASVRRERSGLGDGRVYRLQVTVSDGEGGSCTGTATVGVPHDQGGGSTPIDSGAIYDSLSS